MDHFDGDPLIYDSGDGGDILITGGQPTMSSGLENAVYLSTQVEPNWWGNDIDPANPGAVGSLNLIPLTRRAKLTPGLLNDIEAAAAADLAWMLSDGVAKAVTPSASMLSASSVGLSVDIEEPDGDVTTVRWKLNWAYAEAFA